LLAEPTFVSSQAQAERARRSGLTRIEVGAVTAVLVAAVAALLVVFLPSEADAAGQAERDARRIQRLAADYVRETGSGCPTLTLLERDKRLPGDLRTDDPWGERFRVVCSGDQVSVTSPGRDGKPNTGDDIRVSPSEVSASES
jgi:general secretion pathway protein G